MHLIQASFLSKEWGDPQGGPHSGCQTAQKIQDNLNANGSWRIYFQVIDTKDLKIIG